MTYNLVNRARLNQRVRAILLTQENKLMFIKRVKPGKDPYWVAPGGGVEDYDHSLLDALQRELSEELGATVDVVRNGFVLRHNKAGKELEEHFFVCRLLDYDITQRHGPEFNDPARGEYILDEIDLHPEHIERINIKTEQLEGWLLANLDDLRAM
jgi:8-oxo-dGTP pyrophosphatase MutT (NUDIX family)